MFAYLKLLIRNRIAMWNPVRNMRDSSSKAKVLFTYLGFGVGVLSLYGMLVALEYFLYGAFAQLGEPITMLALTGILCTTLVVITSFFYVLSELFFSKDVLLVSAMPISSQGLLAAKLIRIWLGEAGIALLVCLPVVILYGVGQSMGVWYYLAALLLVPLLPVAPLALVTLISFGLIRISALWKRRDVVTIFFSMGFLILFIYLEMRFYLSAEDGHFDAFILQLVLRQKQLLDMVAGMYPPIRLLTQALTGTGLNALGNGLAFAAINVGAMSLLWLLLGRTYQPLAIRQQETLAKMNNGTRRKARKQGVRTPFMALYRRELREIFTVPVYAMNSLVQAVIFPVIAVAMLLSGGEITQDLAMLPALVGLVPKSVLIAIFAALFAFMTSMNMAAATAVSREGKRHEFFQQLPIAPQTLIRAKLMMGITINVVSVVPLAAMLMVMMPSLRFTLGTGLLLSFLFSTLLTCFALLMDTRYPRFGWKNETEAIKQNGIAALSMFAGMAFILLFGAGFFGLTLLKLQPLYALLIVCGSALALDAWLLHRLMGKAAERYISMEIRA